MRHDKYGRKAYKDLQRAHSEFLKAGHKVIRHLKKAFPVGTAVRVEVSLGRFSFGTVSAHPFSPANADYVVVKNDKTGRNHHFHYAQLDYQRDLP